MYVVRTGSRIDVVITLRDVMTKPNHNTTSIRRSVPAGLNLHLDIWTTF